MKELDFNLDNDRFLSIYFNYDKTEKYYFATIYENEQKDKGRGYITKSFIVFQDYNKRVILSNIQKRLNAAKIEILYTNFNLFKEKYNVLELHKCNKLIEIMDKELFLA